MLIKKENLITYAIILILVFIVIYLLCQDESTFNAEPIVSADGNRYFIQEKYSDKKEAADLMMQINENVMKVIKYLKRKRDFNEYDENPYVKGVVNRILQNWNPERLYENPPAHDGTSFTIAKGEKTYFCLRTIDTHQLHQFDDLLFVALHELSHMGDLKWGHNKTFWEVFKFVLQEAEKAGVYTPYDYGQNPINYCGLDVNYNPYFDSGVIDI